MQVFSFILFLIGFSLPSLAAAQTATVTFTASGNGNPIVTATSSGQPLTSPATVNVGDVLDFEWGTPGAAARGLANLPDGCGATHVGGRKWTATVTGDCSIHFETKNLNIMPSNGTRSLTEGVEYSLQFTATNGVGSPVFSVASGKLPTGLSLGRSGLLSGIPTVPGFFIPNIAFDDGYGGRQVTTDLQFNVSASPPTAHAVSVTVNYGSADNPIPLDITGGAPTSVALATPPSNGSADVAGTEIRYTPASGFSGTDRFEYTATNSSGTSSPATVTIAVKAAPTHTVSWTIDGPGSVPNITFNDDPPPGGTQLGSPVVANESRIISFWFAVADAGAALTEPPMGCGIGAAGLAWYTDPITADCHVTFKFEEIAFSPSALPAAVKGEAYSQQISASGSYLDFSYSISGGDIAHQFSITSDGKLIGTPTEAGSHTIEITATNSRGEHKTQTYALNIVDAAEITIDPTTIPDGEAGARYGPLKLTASGGTAPYTFRIADGVMPAGISLRSDGTIHGGATTSGATNFTVEVTDANSATARQAYSLTIALPALHLGPRSLPAAHGGQSYSQIIQVVRDDGRPTGFDSDWTFEITNGGLPEGMEIDCLVCNTGWGRILRGTPTESGSFTFTLRATGRWAGQVLEQQFTLDVDAPAITLGPDSLPDGSLGATYGPVTLTADGGVAPYTFHQESGRLPLGMYLDSSGGLVGTPTVTGSFSFVVKATDNGGASGSQSFTLTITAPEIAVTLPPLPDGKVNAAYPGVRLTASGGTGPYEFAVAAGTLPDGIQLTADGAISGTPTESGDFTATVMATDSLGFTGTADLSLKIKGLDVPVARDMTLEVMAGTTGSIDLTRGATNGPFTAADIAVHPATEAGKATIRRDGAAHMLDFAAAGAFAGSASLQYTLSNADGRSAPATVTLNVNARPDPSEDPEVIGLLTAQTETARRFAKTQMQNFNRRLEQLHEEGDRRRNSMNVDVGMAKRDSDKTAYSEEDQDRDPVTDAFRRMDSGKKDRQTSSGQDAYNPLGNFAVWTGGYVNFAQADSGGIDLDSTLVGVSGGVDYRLSPNFVAGLGFGYGRDKTEIGENGTESRGRAWSMAAYGSYKPTPEIFVDGLLGYGFMDFDSRRFVTATGNFATGSRDGRQVFGSLTAGYEHRQDGWLASPYGRLEASRSKLDGFTEKGGGIQGLAYADQIVDTLSGVLGLRLEYAMPMDWGLLKPRARLEYTHDFEGSSRASLGYTDIGTMPYGIDIDLFSRDYLTIGLGFDAQIGDVWNLGFDYRTAYGSGGISRDHTFAMKVGASF